MTMGVAGRDKGLLKLVHPGGFIEVHRRPIVAAEIMRKNPRHFVTRPDVFKFPWIVVRPESLLNLGNVFYVVPYHTIHRLTQPNDPTANIKDQPLIMSNQSPKPRCSPKNHHHPRRPKKERVEGGIDRRVDKRIECAVAVVERRIEDRSVNDNVVVLKSCLRNREKDQDRPAWKKLRRVTFLLPDEEDKK